MVGINEYHNIFFVKKYEKKIGTFFFFFFFFFISWFSEKKNTSYGAMFYIQYWDHPAKKIHLIRSLLGSTKDGLESGILLYILIFISRVWYRDAIKTN